MGQHITGEQALRNLRHPRVLHPMLLAVCPVLGLYAQNADHLPMDVMVRPALALAAGSLLLWMILGFTLKSRYRSGLIASVLILGLFVLWGPLEDLINFAVPVFATWPPAFFYAAYAVFAVAAVTYIVIRVRTQRQDEPKHLRTLLIVTIVGFFVAALLFSPLFGRRAAWLITGYLVLLAMVMVSIWRYQGDFHVATRMANWFATILLGLYAIVVIYNLPQPAVQHPPLVTGAVEAEAKPDIYCIVVDGYPRSDVVRSVFGYNNLPFEQDLESKGFDVLNRSRANYSIGLASITAFLNAGYLSEFVGQDVASAAGMATLLELYRENRVFRFLKDQGYRIVAFSPGLESIEPRTEADTLLAPSHALGEFEMVFLNRTFISRIMQGVYYFQYRNPAYWNFEFRRRRILYFAEHIGSVAAQSESPKLVFAHLLVPDPPFLFTRDGERAQPFGQGSLAIDRTFRASPEEYVTAYREQLHFTNRIVLESVDAILRQSPEPPVILVVSGSGARFSRGGADAAARDAFANLIAVHIPQADGGAPPIPADLSLVNVFRVTLDRVFGTKLGTIPDQTFTSTDSRPFAVQQALY